MNANLLDEIEHFFVSYNEAKGKKFKPVKRSGAERAAEIVEEGMRLFRQKNNRAQKSSKKTERKKN